MTWNPRADDWKRALASAQQARAAAATISGSLSSVARTGSYNDLSDKPTIPTRTSQLINDSGFGPGGGGEGGGSVSVSAVPGEHIAEVGTPTVTANGNVLVFDYLKGERGERGEAGPQGIQGVRGETGPRGYTFTPSVSSDGVISWTNNGGLSNPASVNIRGPQGQKGDTGSVGPQGPAGTVDLSVLADYLPLRGGTMTGVIESTADNAVTLKAESGEAFGVRVERADLGKRISFGFGSSGQYYGIYMPSHSQWLAAWMSTHCFRLRALNSDDGTYKDLYGYADGRLTWGGKELERKKAFSSTAIISQKTVSEATHTLTINIPAGYRDVLVRLYCTAGSSSTLQCTATWSDGTNTVSAVGLVSNGVYTSARLNRVRIRDDYGMASVEMAVAAQNSAAAIYKRMDSEVFIPDGYYLTTVVFTPSTSTVNIPVNSKYVVYGVSAV